MRTRVGYTGGTTANPTYTNLGDHTETLQLDYDPQKTTYAELLQIFWASHDPTVQAASRQYMSAIFYHDAAQRRAAFESKAAQEAARGETIETQILPAGMFYLAEDYHQKYRLRNVSFLISEFKAIYPKTADLVASTAVARVNGYVAGYGTAAGLEAEIASYGLSAEAQQRLRQMVAGR